MLEDPAARVDESVLHGHVRRAISDLDDPGSADALRDGIAAAQQRLGIAPGEDAPVEVTIERVVE
tara:strand:- start:306 stop:500 length:195 start_codon:yes stop_codon:yes gene_type:complete